jgi:hypothetical protein
VALPAQLAGRGALQQPRSHALSRDGTHGPCRTTSKGMMQKIWADPATMQE